jgi:hypothetical protein
MGPPKLQVRGEGGRAFGHLLPPPDWDVTPSSLYFWLSLIALAAGALFGAKANAMAAQRAIAHGWELADRHRRRFN